jgi:predicted NAD-dependent protein-ADP-ribosyltransferase YbiA (DUF1768 family)
MKNALQCALCALIPAAAAAAVLVRPCSFEHFDSAVSRFSKFLTFNTVSSREAANHAVHPDEHARLGRWLAVNYQSVWSSFKVQKVMISSVQDCIKSNTTCKFAA